MRVEGWDLELFIFTAGSDPSSNLEVVLELLEALHRTGKSLLFPNGSGR